MSTKTGLYAGVLSSLLLAICLTGKASAADTEFIWNEFKWGMSRVDIEKKLKTTLRNDGWTDDGYPAYVLDSYETKDFTCTISFIFDKDKLFRKFVGILETKTPAKGLCSRVVADLDKEISKGHGRYEENNNGFILGHKSENKDTKVSLLCMGNRAGDEIRTIIDYRME